MKRATTAIGLLMGLPTLVWGAGIVGFFVIELPVRFAAVLLGDHSAAGSHIWIP